MENNTPFMNEGIPSEIMFDGPVPGESLTNDPTAPMPYEKPPKFTNVDKASEHIFMMLTDDGTYEELLEQLRKKVPVENMALVFLHQGFSEGYWNPDLMLLLIEPTIYLIMWLGHEADIDFVLEDGGDDDLYEEEDDILNREVAKQDIIAMSTIGNKEEVDTLKEVEDKMSPSLLATTKKFKKTSEVTDGS